MLGFCRTNGEVADADLLDRHYVVKFSAEEVAKLHVKDLEIQDQYGVKVLTYWYDAERWTTFCLDAPDKETADRVHAEAHGHVANEMISVDLSAVEAFLGHIQETKPIGDSAFRAIMFTDMVGSTEITAQFGDAMSLELLRAHDAIIRRCLEHHCGSEVKHLGDGIMASFDGRVRLCPSDIERRREDMLGRQAIGGGHHRKTGRSADLGADIVMAFQSADNEAAA